MLVSKAEDEVTWELCFHYRHCIYHLGSCHPLPAKKKKEKTIFHESDHHRQSRHHRHCQKTVHTRLMGILLHKSVNFDCKQNRSGKNDIITKIILFWNVSTSCCF